METATNFWWLKNNKAPIEVVANDVTSNNKSEDISSSLREFLEKERALENMEDVDTDIGSIIEEINKVAAESPLGPFEKYDDRSFEDIMKEVEQLSARSRTSANLSTPTPKSASPLPLDYEKENSKEYDEEEDEEYSEDFDDKSEPQTPSANQNNSNQIEFNSESTKDNNDDVRRLEIENKNLAHNVNSLKVQLEERNLTLAKTKANFEKKKPPEINDTDLHKVLEELKDSKETNTALQLQLNTLNQANQQLKSTYDELFTVNANLEKRVLDAESVLTKCSQEINLLKEHRDKLLEAEADLNNLLEIEKMQVKNLKVQNEKDARCILDLNRQVKEMERIIARKHPDSVSALIVAAKNDQSENNLTARKVLEDRIRNLETEVVMRDQQSSKVFLEVQEKFTEMKNKYESHIEDLELHVSDLKNQIKKKRDTFDVYTQTVFDERNPVKDTKAVGVQTLPNKIQLPKIVFNKKAEKVECRDDAHLLATIRGLQTDLVNKEKVIVKMQKELDEARKTNKRLQKEREGSLRNIAEKREFRSYPEKLALQLKGGSEDVNLEEELKALKTERDKMKVQLCRMEEDYQSLKAKRLFDLSALQQAHESEVTTYMTNIGPLRDQLQSQQKTIECLQEQLKVSKEQMEVLRLDRDDLMKRIRVFGAGDVQMPNGDTSSKKICVEDDESDNQECRLKAIVHGLVQNQMANRGCQQCVARQQQLIFYKTELDQLLATVRTLA